LARVSRHNPALDGLRALSVTAVVLYHAGALSGGWVGVEVFFVISGFLITGLLAAEHERNGRIDLVGFWRRRARRLLPGIVMLAAIAAAYLWTYRDTRPSTTAGRDMVGLLTYTSNWVSIGGDGYWGQFEAPSVLRHAWSLAIEEQYYLVFPLIAAVLLRRRAFGRGLAVLTAVALAWQVVASYRFDADRLYLGTDTRAFGLLAGGVLALGLRRRPIAGPRARAVLVAVGLAALGVLTAMSIGFGDAGPASFRGWFQLLVLASAAAILAVHDADHPTVVGRLVGSRPLALVGRWSYGIYLFHWPLLLVLAPHGPADEWLLGVLALAITIPVAGASYQLVEHPIRRRGLAAVGSAPRPAALGAGGLTVAVAALLVGVSATAAAPATADDVLDREPPRADPPSTTTATTTPVTVPATTPVTVADSTAIASTTDAPTTTVPPTTVAADTGLVARPADRPVRVYLVGDSVGELLEPTLHEIAGEAGVEVFSRAAGGCGYDRVRMQYFNQDYERELCRDVLAKWPTDVATFQPDVVFVTFGAWWGWYWNGAIHTQCEPELAAHVRHLYDLALADLGATGAPVYFMSPADWQAEQPPAAPPDTPAYFDCLRANLADWVAGTAGAARILDAYAMLCVDHDCASTVDGEPTRPDGMHVAGPAARAVATAFLAEMIEPPAGGWASYPPIELPD